MTPGRNVITVTGTDLAGNTSTAEIAVTSEALTGKPHITSISGNNQSGPIATQLAEPLIVTLRDTAGNPVPGEPVIFKVAENNGVLSDGLREARSVEVTTDLQGQAQVRWATGTRAGAGNNRVEASAVSFEGAAISRQAPLQAAV